MSTTASPATGPGRAERHGKSAPDRPLDQRAQEDVEAADALLDEALEESFPASDPPAIVRTPPVARGAEAEAAKPARETRREKAEASRELDEELEDTFPASDPPSSTQP